MKLRNKETGDIWELWQADAVHGEKDEFCEGDVEYIRLDMIDNDYDHYGFKYASLKELCEEWEDYKPAEPLIKDEKVRKAVRAWWNAIDHKENGLKPHVDIDEDSGVIDIAYTADIHIEFRNINTVGKLYGYYTIAELCGEEEE